MLKRSGGEWGVVGHGTRGHDRPSALHALRPADAREVILQRSGLLGSPFDLLGVQATQICLPKLRDATGKPVGDPGSGQGIGVGGMRLVQPDAIVRADRSQRPFATPEAIDVLVEHERVDHDQAIRPSNPVDQRNQTMPARLPVEHREVEARVEGHDRGALPQMSREHRGDLLHRHACVHALRPGLLGADAMDLARASWDLDPWIDQPGAVPALDLRADEADGSRYDPITLGIGARGLDVEGCKAPQMPGHTGKLRSDPDGIIGLQAPGFRRGPASSREPHGLAKAIPSDAMCGRYTNTLGPEELNEHFGVPMLGSQGTHRFNIAPTEQVLGIVAPEGKPETRMLRWGLVPHWAKDLRIGNRMINARMETVTTSTAYAPLIAKGSRRALQIADGYYEWLKAERPGEPRQPFLFRVDGGAPFAFAALWAPARVGGQHVESVTLLTCDSASNRVAAAVHDRMPVILADPGAQRAWLDPGLDAEDALALCGPLPAARLSACPANPAVNKAGVEGPELLVAPG